MRLASRAARALMQRLEQPIDPDTPLGQLRVGQQQIVEIAKALSKKARILVMDEPTAALDLGHQELVLTIARELADAGLNTVHLLPAFDIATIEEAQVLYASTNELESYGRAPGWRALLARAWRERGFGGRKPLHPLRGDADLRFRFRVRRQRRAGGHQAAQRRGRGGYMVRSSRRAAVSDRD